MKKLSQKSSGKNIRSIIILLFIVLPLIGFVFGAQFQSLDKKEASLSQKNKDKSGKSLFLSSKPVTIAGWNRFTSQANLDLQFKNEFLEKYPELIQLPRMTFQYPKNWKVAVNFPPSSSDPKMSTSTLRFAITKTPEQTECNEGGCTDAVWIDFDFGVVPEGIKPFDSKYWGHGFVSSKDVSEKINNIDVIKSYRDYEFPNPQYPSGVLFYLTKNHQLNTSVVFNQTDIKCTGSYCRQTSEEINKILSTIAFIGEDDFYNYLTTPADFEIHTTVEPK
jgi:hypothetical protein